MSKTKNKELIKEVIQEMTEQERQNKKRKVFRNTELLMKNYTVLKQHSENAIYSFSQSTLDLELEQISFDDLYIEAILKSKIRTTIMIQHIDMALDLLHRNSSRKGFIEEAKYNTLIDIFLNGQAYEDLAEKYNCASRTIVRWRNDMLKALGMLLFGVDGLLNELAVS